VAPIVPAGTKDIGLARELGRKAIHLGALVMPLGLWFVPVRPARGILFGFFLLLAAIDISRWTDTPVSRWLRRTLHLVLRPHERKQLSGGTYILAAGTLCAVLYPKPVAVAALICIIVGDTAAVFVGRGFGRIKIGSKTLEGSLAFFLASLLAILWIPGLSLSIKVIGAAVAAVVEALPLPTDDNITVPLAAGAVMWWLL
jgi:dolichol kinase